MGKINIGDVRPGMILAADVQDRNGRTLLAKGVEISEKHIRIFKMWGISEADIQGVAHEDVEAQETAALDPEILRKADLETQELFTHAGSQHPGVKELVRLSTMRRVRTLMEASHGH